MTSVARPSTFGPSTIATTLTTVSVTTAINGARSGRSSPSTRRRDPRKSIAFATGMAMPVAKAMDFRGSLRRVLGELRPERAPLIAVVTLTVVSVVAMVLGPKVLGRATDVIFAGVVGRML